MKITFENDNIVSTINPKLDEISSVIIDYIPKNREYSISFFGHIKGISQRVIRKTNKIIFENIILNAQMINNRKIVHFFKDKKTKKYISYYPEGF